MIGFHVISVFPEMFSAISDFGVSGRAFRNGLASLKTWNPRDFTDDKHRTVDDRPYGGGCGMVMMPGPLTATIEAAKADDDQGMDVVFLSPQGKLLDASMVSSLASRRSLALVCGRYQGIDERVISQYGGFELSIGDYVLSGGEMAAMVVIDAVLRQIPGVLGNEDSATEDSFAESGLLASPCYTRPPVFQGQSVPDVLRNGDHEAIRQWRLVASVRRTIERRPDIAARLATGDNGEISELLVKSGILSVKDIDK